MKKSLYLYLDDTYFGEATVEGVRDRETWMFRYDEAYLKADRPR